MSRKKLLVTIDVVASGRAGGRARAANLSEQELSDSASNAAKERWDAYYEAHPEKLKERQEREAKRGTVRRGRPPKKKAGKKKS
jgi:hypothetical protein